MKFNVDKSLEFDFSNFFVDKLGKEHGVKEEDIFSINNKIKQAYDNVEEIRKGKVLLHGEPALFMSLPYQSNETIAKIQSWACDVAKNYDNVVSIGIGGSYLGNKTLQDALVDPFYNECESKRKGFPKIILQVII